MKKDIYDFCQDCSECAYMKNPTKTVRAPMQQVKAGYPNEIVGVDIMGPLQETPSHKR